MADGPDELFALRNFFYLGNYQLAINEGSTLSPSSETLKGERDMFVYRSYIAQGNYKFALDEIKDNASIALQSVRLLATYLASEDNKDISLITLKEWLSDPISANNPTLQIIAGIIYCHERNYEEALRCVHQGTTLEMIALMIQVFLRMDRVDLAEKQLKIMQQTEDDATLTQLATAYVSMAQVSWPAPTSYLSQRSVTAILSVCRGEPKSKKPFKYYKISQKSTPPQPCC